MKPLITIDMDNTLINADKAHVNSFNQAFKKNNLKQIPARKLKPLFGMPKEQVIRTVHPNISDKLLKQVVKDKKELIKFQKGARAFRGAKETIKALKKNYKIALITNASTSSMKHLMKLANFPLKLFDAHYSYEDVKNAKPAPDLIFKVEKKLKQKALYHIGDSIYDVRAAKAAKTKSIAVLSGHYSKKTLQKEKPTLIITNIKKLKKIL